MPFERVEVTLTSDNSGDASETTKALFGKIVRISAVGVTAPSTNWDLEITCKGANDLDITLFNDDTVTNSTTVPDFWYPVGPAAKTADGSASSLTEKDPVVFGPLTVVGAAMGDTKSAKVEIIIEVA